MKPPAFQFYADDFLGGVADMTQAEVGAYILLLCHQWNRGSTPVEPDRQQMVAKGPVSDHVLGKFKLCADGLLRNERMEDERKKQDNHREKQRLKGIASGRARANNTEPRFNHGSTTVQPSGEPEGNSPSPSPINSLSLTQEAHFPEAEVPSWEEFRDYCTSPSCLLVAEWYVKDKYLKAMSKNWKDCENWRAYAQRCKTWWEQSGRPMCQNVQNENNNRTAPRRVDRNKGTLNEGQADKYAEYMERQKNKPPS